MADGAVTGGINMLAGLDFGMGFLMGMQQPEFSTYKTHFFGWMPKELASDDVSATTIPEWVKNNAGWWIEGKISDTEFTMALQYLVKTGIITVNLSKA